MPTVGNAAARDRLRAIVASVLELDLEDVAADAHFYTDLGADSLEKVEITVRIEHAFQVTLAAEDSATLHTVTDAVALLAARGVLNGHTDGTDLVRHLVGDHLEAGRGAHPAYLDPDVGEVSYARLHLAARGYAGALHAAGVPPGSRCLIVAEDSVATVVALLGLWWHGCVPVPVSPLLSDADLRFVADDCAAALVHLDVGEARGDVLAREFAALPRLTGDQVRQGLRDGAPTGAHRPDDAPDSATWPDGTEALVQYTSGSTGRPKGVRHAADGITAMLDGFGPVMGLCPDDVVLSTARMSFGYGFGSSVLCPLRAGACTALVRGPVDLHVVVAALRRHRPTVLCSVPRMYVALLDLAAREGTGPHQSLRLCLTAGEHCPAALGERIRDTLDVELVNCLGATEVMHIVLATPRDRPMPGTLGLPVPGVTLTVRDETGAEVPEGAEGRLHVAGAQVALGYLDRPDSQRTTFADGGAYTGDVVRRTPDGAFHHLCRADDILNLGGYKVVPAEIEAVARATDGVTDCVVVGATDADGLQQAVLYAVPEPGADQRRLRRAVLAAVRTSLAPYKRPARVEFLDTLPTTTTGKVATYRLRAQAVRP